MRRPVRAILLVAFLVLPLLLQGASLPHTHSGGPHGLFNHEHDLTLLAITGTVASLDAIAPAAFIALVVVGMAFVAGARPAATLARADASRAPPLR
jgi:hypothetical protein